LLVDYDFFWYEYILVDIFKIINIEVGSKYNLYMGNIIPNIVDVGMQHKLRTATWYSELK